MLKNICNIGITTSFGQICIMPMSEYAGSPNIHQRGKEFGELVKEAETKTKQKQNKDFKAVACILSPSYLAFVSGKKDMKFYMQEYKKAQINPKDNSSERYFMDNFFEQNATKLDIDVSKPLKDQIEIVEKEDGELRVVK
ncbi:MAG: hypothetical protein A2Y25_09435 [Candidatus Melainabacteria bacterium GWF2_37_15]|nr:MAG: hypothetical protein A2Y25_09435 [Candidatus Melainabacteria bacterium GWF2_37_15]